MYAVIKTGGKQYRVAEDDVIEVERLAVEAGDAVVDIDLAVGDVDIVDGKAQGPIIPRCWRRIA